MKLTVEYQIMITKSRVLRLPRGPDQHGPQLLDCSYTTGYVVQLQ
jgi:hypothetical protein